MEGTEIARAGGAGDPLEDAQEVLRVRGQDEEDDRSRVAAGKTRVRAREKKKKVVGSGVDGR